MMNKKTLGFSLVLIAVLFSTTGCSFFTQGLGLNNDTIEMDQHQITPQPTDSVKCLTGDRARIIWNREGILYLHVENPIDVPTNPLNVEGEKYQLENDDYFVFAYAVVDTSDQKFYIALIALQHQLLWVRPENGCLLEYLKHQKPVNL